MQPYFLHLFFLLSFCYASIQAQVNPTCGSDIVRNYWNTKFSDDNNSSEIELDNTIRSFLEEFNPSSSRASYTIPVVVHIIHQNGSENISDALVQTGIDHLNQSFANAGYYDQGSGVDIDIDFCLAKRDPNGLLTNGITRDVSSYSNVNIPSEDIDLKNVNRWDPTQYLNIWLVKSITSAASGSGVIGYAYFPNAHGSLVDGVVMEANYFGSSQSRSIVTAHEVGHYLGLYHTFEGGCANNNCQSQGDRICDTPPDASTFSNTCSNVTNSCLTDEDDTSLNNPFRPISMGGLGDQPDMVTNYMDYESQNCVNDFTSGQKDRMIAALLGIRSSLLNPLLCEVPCTINLDANFNASSLNIPIGTNVTFTNSSTPSLNYVWTVEGSIFSSSYHSDYTFNNIGTFDVLLEVRDDDGLCYDFFELEVTAYCPAQASFSSSNIVIEAAQTINFTNTSTNATTYEWYVNGNLESTAPNFSFTFNEFGWHEVYLVAGNNLCSSTSNYQFIQVGSGNIGGGLPIWIFSDLDGGEIILNDWRTNPPTVSEVTNNDILRFTSAGIAFDDCGDIAFYVMNDGSGNANSLLLFDKNGNTILSPSTSNGPGLNGVRGESEIQVVRVPNSTDEWYIIYREWRSDAGAPINNATYYLLNLLYSKVRYDGNVLTVIERDIKLLDGSNQAYTYVDGKAISRTGPTANSHYLYACRRATNTNTISTDRFIIDANEIRFDKNTGEVPAPYWSLTAAGSFIELSPVEDRLAIVARNEDNNRPDIFIFETNTFDNNPSNYQAITGNKLILQPDGILVNSPTSIEQAATLPNLGFLRNFDRKLTRIEFSPNGQYLYVTGGGYSQSGVRNLTYLAQIDLATTYPYNIRLQVQDVPFGLDINTGVGCSNSACINETLDIRDIQSAPNGNLYYTKWNGTYLYAIPDPNDPMPQSLTPTDVDLSSLTEPNININHRIPNFPDQIDGYNYLSDAKIRLPIVVRKMPCSDTCVSYTLEIQSNGTTLESFDINACAITNYIDTIYFCVDSNKTYNLLETNNLNYDNAIINGAISYPIDGYFDFTPEYDSIVPNLGPDTNFCNSFSLPLDAGSNYDSYLWNTGSTSQTITVTTEGSYNVQVTTTQGCIFNDTIEVNNANASPRPDLGPDTSSCSSGVFVLNPGNYVSYLWNDGSMNPTLTVHQSGIYIVTVEDSCGNIMQDSIVISSNSDSIEVDNFPKDSVVCEGTTITLSPQINGSGQFTWESNGSLIGSSPSLNITALMDEAIVLTIQNDCSIFKDTFNLIVKTIPNAVISGNGNLCSSQDSIPIQVSIMNGLPPYSFVISNGINSNQFTISSSDTVIFVNQVGDYTLSQLADPFCEGTFSGLAQILGSNLTFDTEVDFEACIDRLASITVENVQNGAPPYQYSMDGITFINNASFTNLSEGIYNITVQDDAGCTATSENIIVPHLDAFSIETANDTSICLGDSVNLWVTVHPLNPNTEISWTPTDQIDCDDCLSILAVPHSNTEFIVTVIDTLGCSQFDTILVKVIEGHQIDVPNAFSPNGDGLNDIFYVLGSSKLTLINSFRIYNRWGEEVFSATNIPVGDPKYGWDGTINNERAMLDNYAFYIEASLKSGEIITKSGNVVVIY